MGYDFCNVVTRRAAKPHKCSWCKGIIEKGEAHEYGTSLFDGDFSNWRSHTDCHSAYHVARDLCGCGFNPEDWCSVCNPDAALPRASIPDPDDDTATLSIVQALVRLDAKRCQPSGISYACVA